MRPHAQNSYAPWSSWAVMGTVNVTDELTSCSPDGDCEGDTDTTWLPCPCHQWLHCHLFWNLLNSAGGYDYTVGKCISIWCGRQVGCSASLALHLKQSIHHAQLIQRMSSRQNWQAWVVWLVIDSWRLSWSVHCIPYLLVGAGIRLSTRDNDGIFQKIAGHVDGNRGCIVWYMQDKIHRVMVGSVDLHVMVCSRWNRFSCAWIVTSRSDYDHASMRIWQIRWEAISTKWHIWGCNTQCQNLLVTLVRTHHFFLVVNNYSGKIAGWWIWLHCAWQAGVGDSPGMRESSLPLGTSWMSLCQWHLGMGTGLAMLLLSGRLWLQ